MPTSEHPVRQLILRAVLKDISPIVARVVSVPDSLAIRDFHELFLAMLDWQYDPDFILRIHAQQFASYRRHSRGKRLRDFQLRRQEKFLYICDTLDLWEWEVRVLDVEPVPVRSREPRCVKGRGAGPPAMCGGPTGYRLMLRRQTAEPELADPETTSASVALLATAYQDEPDVDWAFLETAINEGWQSVEERLVHSGPLTPSQFNLKETNERVTQWWQCRRAWQ